MAGIWLNLTREDGKSVLVNMGRIIEVKELDPPNINYPHCRAQLNGDDYEIRVRESLGTIEGRLTSEINAY